MADTTKTCPVCGNDLNQPAAAEAVACPRCQFPYAGVTRFAGPKSLEVWRELVRGKRLALIQSLQALCKKERCFYLSSSGIACKPVESQLITLVGPDGLKVLDNPFVVQYSAAENASRNEAFLLKDGTVRSRGDNYYSQCETGSMAGIKHVLATATCTYGITAAGETVFCGQPVSRSVSQWRNILDLAAGENHLVGLTTDGRVLVAGEMLNRSVVSTIESWRSISSIAAAGHATLALRRDGVVVLAGQTDPRRPTTSKWTGIADAALESVYAVGLTYEGNVLLAGECKNDYFDMGRKNAANWTEIIAISCARSGIAALGIDGTLYLAGNIREAARIKAAWEGVRQTFMDQLIRAAV